MSGSAARAVARQPSPVPTGAGAPTLGQRLREVRREQQQPAAPLQPQPAPHPLAPQAAASAAGDGGGGVDSGMCVICMERHDHDARLQPCGHACVCAQCAGILIVRGPLECKNSLQCMNDT